MERSIFPKKNPREMGEAAFQRDCIDECWYVPQQGTSKTEATMQSYIIYL